MKKQFTLLSFLIFALFAAYNASAQNYNHAIGARLGYPLAASYKKFLNEGNAIELYAAYRGASYYNWFSINGAYQLHRDFPNVENLQWYFGAGAGVLFWNFKNSFAFADDYASTTFSIQGYLGLEYTFEEVPLSISADWIPSFALAGYDDGFYGGYAGLGVRYVISR